MARALGSHHVPLVFQKSVPGAHSCVAYIVFGKVHVQGCRGPSPLEGSDGLLGRANQRSEADVSRSRLPRPVRKLLETDVESIEKVELIRYLQSAAAPVPRAELARVLDLDREAADTLIAELAHAGLVEVVGVRGAVRPGAAAADEACGDLMRIYDEDRAQVISVLSTLALQRIRNMAARTFGEALVSKKKPKDDEDEP